MWKSSSYKNILVTVMCTWSYYIYTEHEQKWKIFCAKTLAASYLRIKNYFDRIENFDESVLTCRSLAGPYPGGQIQLTSNYIFKYSLIYVVKDFVCQYFHINILTVLLRCTHQYFPLSTIVLYCTHIVCEYFVIKNSLSPTQQDYCTGKIIRTIALLVCHHVY